MKKLFPVEELARDDRFRRVAIAERITDGRTPANAKDPTPIPGRLTPARPDAPDAARSLMHGIFKQDDNAADVAVQRYRARFPLAARASQSIIIYDLGPPTSPQDTVAAGR